MIDNNKFTDIFASRAREEQRKYSWQLIKDLERAEGVESQLISLYIPPNKHIINELGNELGNEEQTALHIQNVEVREHVRNALHMIARNLVMDDYGILRENGTLPPEHGLVMFAGAVDNTSRYHLQTRQNDLTVFSMFDRPVNVSIYRCDNRFYVEPLKVLIDKVVVE